YMTPAAESGKITNHVALFNSEGEFVWENQVLAFATGNSYKSGLATSPFIDNRYWLASWADNRESGKVDTQGIFMQRINIDGSLGSITCFAPSPPVAVSVSQHSAKLEWEGGAGNYELSWASAVDDEWTTVKVKSKSFDLTGLTPATSYRAKIRSICAPGDTSVYSPVYSFTTSLGTGIRDITGEAWNVYASGNVINILNPGKTAIHRIRLYNLQGVILKDYTVRTHENVRITTPPEWSVLIVKIEGEGTAVSSRVIKN
ncbi:MAG: hypothetical protein LBC48_02405, partial [Dysgonamonadaceae bacterium]|nr:hypothetical protein [Dysgonamonadaceae bacterium]